MLALVAVVSFTCSLTRFKRGQYQIEAVRAQRPGVWGNALALRDVEAKLVTKREEMKKFEQEFRKVQPASVLLTLPQTHKLTIAEL
eukprot:scaffold651823_cov51-Prasinocladus_malaysianus.AAC.1